MSTDRITGDVRDGIATITIDNAPLNVLTLGMTRALSDLLDAYAIDPAVRVLILTGAGAKSFCAGSDVKEFPELQAKGTLIETKLRFENATYDKVAHFPKPTIAVLNGITYGGGLELAICCDFIIAGRSVRLASPEIFLGVFPGSGATLRLPRRVGDSRAKQLMFFGKPIDAQTALDWGLVDRMTEDGEAMPAALDMAGALAEQSNTALAGCKAAMRSAIDKPEAEAMVDMLDLAEKAFATPDCKEGVRAFFAKVKPVFNRGPQGETDHG